MEFVCLTVGAVLIYASCRLGLSVSDERAQRLIKSRGAGRMPEAAATCNIFSGAGVALAVLFIGLLLIAGGLATLVGWDMFK